MYSIKNKKKQIEIADLHFVGIIDTSSDLSLINQNSLAYMDNMIIPLSDIKIGIENLKHALDMTSQFGLTDILTDESVNLYKQRFRAHYRKQKYTIISCKMQDFNIPAGSSRICIRYDTSLSRIGIERGERIIENSKPIRFRKRIREKEKRNGRNPLKIVQWDITAEFMKKIGPSVWSEPEFKFGSFCFGSLSYPQPLSLTFS
ncbi:hypothetical protein HZH68_000973 [Vespula germanica]|uniref:Uncharacterized protein n=1 Tax=Vespula germanica TaxID=30212 RepID=A0A834U6I6_VESGE|nr:hypothetical protein HZH68_000973 [Vespula germanica]